ncbi:collagen alpha-2(I) chain [Pteronotus mesoamericanus]|uniref:collagen alpha-2(I) chain n=1 Tax=Pteronotus mesoamericanus TaxID=1884717 RepID=UPI0023EBA443|nr:collagen alpha-2(I) chain [Pteronotus parnellii mesoamericanus]
MSWATGRGLFLLRLRRGERAAEMPGRCVRPSRSRHGVRWPRGKRWVARTTRGRRVRRRVRSLVWETRCVSAERLQPKGRQPRGRRPAADTAGAKEASRSPGTAGSMEAAGDPGAVWVNGAVGEPQVVGPAGSVWVTDTGEEEQTVYRSPRGCERKGRPGSMGHESILELWLKVQAMRAASGCGEGSRVELHPVPPGEGPVERGVPGRASWVETSRGGLTGPWVEGQVRAAPQASGISTVTGLRAGCERPSGLSGPGQAVGVPPVGVPGAVEIGSAVVPPLLEAGQAVGVPGAVEEIGQDVAPGHWGKGPTVRVRGAVAWPEAVEVPRAAEGEVGCGGAPGLWGRGQSMQVPGASVQDAVCGGTLGLWGRGQAMGVPRAVEEETASVGAPGIWRRRPALEEIGPGGIPDLWGTREPVGVPCATEEETRCGGDPGFRDRGQAVWAETGSAGDPGSWEAAQTAGVSGPDEQEAGPEGAPGLWSVGQVMGVPRALGKEVGCGGVPGLWGIDQPVGVSQAGAVPEVIGGQARFGDVPGLWDRQQALGQPLADSVPGEVGEETCCENVLSLWERRPAIREQEALVPTALGLPGCVGPETGYRDDSCPCRRREQRREQAVGLSETIGMSESSSIPKHRCAPAGVPTATGVPGSGRVPAAVWASGPVCPEIGSRDVLNLWERGHTSRIPMASGVPAASEELFPVRENAGSAVLPGLWGGRQVIGVPETDRVSVAPDVPGLLAGETSSGGVPRSWGRRPSARVPVAAVEVPNAPGVPCPLGVETGPGGFSHLPGRRGTSGAALTAGVSTAGGVPPAPRASRPMQVESGSGGVSGSWGERETAQGPADARGPTRMLMPATARMPGSISGLLAGRQTAGVSMAVGLCKDPAVPGPVGEETLSRSLLGLSGRRQTAEKPVAAGVSMAVGVPTAAGVPGPMVGDTSSEDVSGVWGRRRATERPSAARAPGPVDGETGSEGVSGLWRRRPNGLVPEAVRAPLSLGVLAAVGVPMAGRVPAAVWVAGSAGEETSAAVSGLTVSRKQSTEGPGASGEETGGRSILGLAERSQATGVSYTPGRGTRLCSCPGSVGGERGCENVPPVSGTRMTAGVSEAGTVSPVSREETGTGRFRGDRPRKGRGQAERVSGIRVRGDGLGENCVGEDRLRGPFQ